MFRSLLGQFLHSHLHHLIHNKLLDIWDFHHFTEESSPLWVSFVALCPFLRTEMVNNNSTKFSLLHSRVPMSKRNKAAHSTPQVHPGSLYQLQPIHILRSVSYSWETWLHLFKMHYLNKNTVRATTFFITEQTISYSESQVKTKIVLRRCIKRGVADSLPISKQIQMTSIYKRLGLKQIALNKIRIKKKDLFSTSFYESCNKILQQKYLFLYFHIDAWVKTEGLRKPL